MPFPLPPTSPIKKHLVLTLDAFGTLFIPREPIARQYIDVARKCGISIADQDEGRVMSSFKEAFKKMSIDYPNYGYDKGMEPRRWWAEVINNTIAPFVDPDSPHALPPSERFSSGTTIPTHLTNVLLKRFSSKRGYTLYPDAQPFFSRLRFHYKRAASRSTVKPLPHLFHPYTSLLVGVVTNSDDRVVKILRSLEISVKKDGGSTWTPTKPIPLLFDEKRWNKRTRQLQHRFDDIHFITTSYQARSEKPDAAIFDAAKVTALRMTGWSLDETDFVHVGDDYRKDFQGAKGAGWGAILLDRDGSGGKGARAVDEGDPDLVGNDEDLIIQSLEDLVPLAPRAEGRTNTRRNKGAAVRSRKPHSKSGDEVV